VEAGQKTLTGPAKAIVQAFGFEFDHAFGFCSKLTGRNVIRSQLKYERSLPSGGNILCFRGIGSRLI
jgi:hypothetical protein